MNRVFEMQLMPGLLHLIKTNGITVNTDTKVNTNNINNNIFDTNINIDTNIHTKLQMSKSMHENGHINTQNDCDDIDDSINTNIIAENICMTPDINQLQSFMHVLDDGLDFGVVAIYSCPNSCYDYSNDVNGNSSGVLRELCCEVAVIQPPQDIGI